MKCVYCEKPEIGWSLVAKFDDKELNFCSHKCLNEWKDETLGLISIDYVEEVPDGV